VPQVRPGTRWRPREDGLPRLRDAYDRSARRLTGDHGTRAAGVRPLRGGRHHTPTPGRDVVNTFEIAQIYRRFCDEPDSTFLENADVAVDLRDAYSTFRNTVSQVLPWYYATTRALTVTDTTGDYTQYDLRQGDVDPTGAGTPSILGEFPNAAGVPTTRLQSLLAIDVMNAAGTEMSYRMRQANSMDALVANGRSYFLRGSSLWFRQGFEHTVRVHYVPQQSIGVGGAQYDPDWSGVLTSVTAAFVDDFHDWHDIVALMAYDNYAIMDGAANPLVINRLGMRMSQFETYLQSIEYSGGIYVSRVSAP